MQYQQIVPVANNQIVLPLPAGFENGRKVTVIVEDEVYDKASFDAAMAEAANDPLFLSDINEVMEDFKYVDREHFGEDE